MLELNQGTETSLLPYFTHDYATKTGLSTSNRSCRSTDKFHFEIHQLQVNKYKSYFVTQGIGPYNTNSPMAFYIHLLMYTNVRMELVPAAQLAGIGTNC
jgi:hypothetical protein